MSESTKAGNVVRVGGSTGSIYGLGIIGAAVYFIQHATSFWSGLLGLLEALVWPAVLIYHIFEALHI